jgi:two-component system, OmpR family, KDP operon response regulator KdpE
MVTRPFRVLVVDDEPQIRRVLRIALEAQGLDLRVAADGEAALDTLRDWPADLLITDLSMPGVDGLELCRRVRQKSRLPIIVLSVKGEERIKVAALDAGADDYITKPFGMDELLARVRAIMRRAPADAEGASRLDVGDFVIDTAAHTAAVAGHEVHLTPKEFELLTYFARHPGRVLTHRAVLGAVWGAEHTEQTEYLRVFVGQLRKKIESNPSDPRYLRTEPWVGYRFDPGVTTHPAPDEDR